MRNTRFFELYVRCSETGRMILVATNRSLVGDYIRARMRSAPNTTAEVDESDRVASWDGLFPAYVRLQLPQINLRPDV